MATFTLDRTATALVLIDLQAGIVGLPLMPHLGPEVARRAAALAASCRRADVPVFYVRVDLGARFPLPVDRPMQDPSAPPPPAAASELVPEAGFRSGDTLVTKRQWGAFYATELDQLLRRRGVRTIVLAGIATNLGVESTARAAFDRGYAVVFAGDAMTSFDAVAHRLALEQVFPLMGRVTDVAALSAALAA